MATMATTTSTVTPIAGSKNNILQNRPSGISVLGLPVVSMKGRMKCMTEEKFTGKCVSHLSTVCAAAAAVDERMSTEGTGLPFRLSNNLLVWILLGMFGLISCLLSRFHFDRSPLAL